MKLTGGLPTFILHSTLYPMSKLRCLTLFLLFSLVTTTLMAQWADKSLVETHDLKVVEFINSHTGFVGGDSGTFYRTTNAGDSWEWIDLNTHDPILHIDFVSETVGFMSGPRNVLYTTNNAGITWSSLPLPDSITGFTGIDFVDEDLGFAVTNDIPDALIYKTTDGGQSWSHFRREGYVSNDPYYYAANYPLYSSIVYISDEEIYVGGCMYNYSQSYASRYVPFIEQYSADLVSQGNRIDLYGKPSQEFSTFSDLVTPDGETVYALRNHRIITYPVPSHDYNPVYRKAANSQYFGETRLGFWRYDYCDALGVAPNHDLYVGNFNTDSSGHPEVWNSYNGGTSWGEGTNFPGINRIYDIDWPGNGLGYFVGQWGKIYRYGSTITPGNDDFAAVYPNPFQDQFTFQFEGGVSRNGEARIYDIQGRLVHKVFFADVPELNVEVELARGMYVIRLELSNGEMMEAKLLRW
jgi:hypothetical protein